MSKIWEEANLAGLSLKNRVVRSATNENMAVDGLVGQQLTELYRALGEGGVGLLITGHMYVSKDVGRASPKQGALYDDRFVPGLAKAVSAAAESGCKVFVQLSHAGAKAAPEDPASQPVAPSACEILPGRPARALTVEEIAGIRADFVAAAVRAKAAGAHGVQVHLAHNYLLSEFLTPQYNTRTDLYGGTAEKRMALPLSIIAGIKEACGASFPILVKLNGHVEQGDDVYQKDLSTYARLLKQAGVAAIEVSHYDFAQKGHCYNEDRALLVKRESGLPVIVVGGYHTAGEMEAALAKGLDFVALCRPLICETDLCGKLREGKAARCISCNQCFVLSRENGLTCVFHQK